ncbi:hypothetical protein [Methylorubrum thiocyanatum]|uniref:hypothetical protein n=1 Tax=Methylorubrum thiocyanatum TaxID=47958 RepID=UPI00398C2785
MRADIVDRLLAGIEGEPADIDALTPGGLADLLRDEAEGVDGADLFVALVGHPRHEVAMPAASELVRFAFDAFAMVEASAWLGRGGRVSAQAGPLGRAFLEKAGDRGADYCTRSHALKAAMILSQSDRSLFRRLQSDLLGLDTGDDGEYLRHAARIAGAVLAQQPDDDDLREVLSRLADVDDATDEAAMELGLDALRRGLDATAPDEALDAFRFARDCFHKAEKMSEARPDATLYRRCLDALVTFQAGNTPSDLRTRIDEIKASAFAYTAYLTTPDRPEETASWLGLKARERIHWSLLALRLGALDTSLQRAWLHASNIIQDELLSVYAASRSLLRRGADSGLEAVLRPRIVGALQKDVRSLDLLSQWIDANEGSGLIPDASDLRNRVADAREALVTHRPTAAAIGSSPAAALIEPLPDPARTSALARVAAGMAMLVEKTTPLVVSELFETVVDGLRRNEDFRADPEGRAMFEVVIWQTLLFLVLRSNVGVSTLSRGKYLFERDRKKLPVEKDLQDDYYEFLMGTALSEICGAERRDLGGGRADIFLSFFRTKTVAELKRTSLSLTNAKVVERFGLQKVSYDVTNVRYGVLMVLDLRDLDGGQPHVSERVSVHHLTPAWGSSEHAVVLFRVQGCRETPSQV